MKPLIEILDNENILYRLNNVDFSRVDEDITEENELKVEDDFEIADKESDSFSVKLRRHVFFEPAAFFDISVEFEVARLVSEPESVSLDVYNLEEVITEENVDELTGYYFNRAASLISSITSSFGLNPLITSPFYYSDSLEDSE